jgi:hypothetical protein
VDIWQDSVQRAREETGYQGPDVARTIDGIGAALRVDRRAEFYAGLAKVSTGDEFDGLINLWWPQAVIDAASDDDAEDFALAHYVTAQSNKPTQYTHEQVVAEMEHAS